MLNSPNRAENLNRATLKVKKVTDNTCKVPDKSELMIAIVEVAARIVAVLAVEAVDMDVGAGDVRPGAREVRPRAGEVGEPEGAWSCHSWAESAWTRQYGPLNKWT